MGNRSSFEGTRKDLIGRHRRKAAERGLPWTLTPDEYASALGDGVCHWCKGGVWGNGVGLDRIDNLKGYEAANVVACCPTCNAERRTLSFAEYTAVWMVRRSVQTMRASRNAALAVMSKARAGHLHHGNERGHMPAMFKGRQPEWRTIVATRIAKREAGLDPDEQWPAREEGESDVEYRKRLGVTQRQFATLVGSSKRTVQRREARRRLSG